VKKLKRLLLALRVHSLGRTDSGRFGLFGLWALGFGLRKTRFVLGLVLLALPLFFLTRANTAHVSALTVRQPQLPGPSADCLWCHCRRRLLQHRASTSTVPPLVAVRPLDMKPTATPPVPVQCSGPLGTNDCRVRVANGYVTVYLGSVTSFPKHDPLGPAALPHPGRRWYDTSSGSITWDGEMSPRLKLTAVPYAMNAKTASQLTTSSGLNIANLSIAAPVSGNQSFVLQDQGAAGTYNLLVAPSGSDGYVKLQGGTPTQQTGGFNVSGNGTVGGVLQGGTLNAGSTQQFGVDANGNVTTSGTVTASTSVLTPTLDTATATTLSIGTTNATSINLNQNTVVAAGKV
jgi:hypothetical protein